MDESVSMLDWIEDYEPTQIALEVDSVRKYSYRDLIARAKICADILQKTEVPKGSICGLDTSSSFEFLADMLGALHAGMAVLPFPPQLSEDTKRLLKQVAMPVPEGSAIIHLTSGSSGASKLVVRPLENLYDEAFGVASALNLNQRDRVCISTPMQHSFGSGMMMACLYAGSTILAPDYTNLPHKLGVIRQWASKGRIRVLVGVPYIFQQLLRTPFEAPDMRSWAGGEPLMNMLAYRWKSITGGVLRQEYGLSEGGIVSFGKEKDPINSVGRAITGVRVATVRDKKQPDLVRSGSELQVWRTGALRYYANEPGTFGPDGEINTGDLGVIHRDGLIYVLGRLKSVIVVAGMKVTPGEIEAELTSEPGVLDAQVFGFPDEETGQRPVAFVIRGEESDVTPRELRRSLKARMETYKVPTRIIFVPDFPRTVSGKVDRIELLKSAAEAVARV